MKGGYLIDHVERAADDADERLARHLATARRQTQARDEMGRIVERLPSLAAWEEPKRQVGQSPRHGGGRFRFFGLRLPVRAWAALKALAERRGVMISYLIYEGIAHVLTPVLTDVPRGLADRPLDLAQPQRVHPRRGPAPPPHGATRGGFLTDRR